MEVHAALAAEGIAPRVWQRGYHDRIIRDDEELSKARWYIRTNPARWAARAV
jgi:hypothetical protein